MKQAALLLLLPVVSLCLPPAAPQTEPNLSVAVVQLLDEPAPPVTVKEVADARAAQNRWPNSRDPDRPEPGAGAPAKVVIEYWDCQSQFNTGRRPSDEAGWRLLEAVLQDPRFYPRVLAFLPDTPPAQERVKRFLDSLDAADKNNAGHRYTKDAQESLRAWLSRHGRYERDLLLRNAKQVTDENLDTDGDADLEALIKLDWSAAEPIVNSLINNSSPQISSYAIGLRYQHSVAASDLAEAEVLRERLKSLASDMVAAESVREFALNAIMQDNWTGRDDWFISLLQEPRPAGEKAADVLRPFGEVVGRNPEHWIPILTRLVGHGNKNLHNAAVFCLSELRGHRARLDAVTPLLPWLFNREWSTAGEHARINLIESMAELKMPECVPGLLSIVQKEKEYPRSKAAAALARLRDPRAIPVLRKALEKPVDDYGSNEMIDSLIALGLSDAETTKALEAVASETKAEPTYYGSERFLYLSGAKSIQGAIGQALVNNHVHISDALAGRICMRATELRSTAPHVAETLWLIAQQWNQPSVDAAVAERIADGSADLYTLLTALKRRDGLKTNAADVLRRLLSRGGYGAGVSAVLLSDAAAEASILESKDNEARIGLLACARIVREDLDVKLIARFLSDPNKLLGRAALRYLESADTPESRELLQSQQPAEILIQGARDSFDPKPKFRQDWIAWEDGLRRDVKSRRAEEVFGQLEFHYSDTAPLITRNSVEIRVRGDQAEVCKRKDDAREECRGLLPAELQNMRELFDRVSFDDLPPIVLMGGGFGGSEEEFVRLNRQGGRRVYAANLHRLHYMDTWSLKNLTPHEQLDAFFRDLKKTGEFELRYALKEKLKELEVLAADDQHPVSHVAGEGGELRVLVKDRERNWDAIKKGQKDDSINWHVLSDGRIGGVAEQPLSCEILDDRQDIPEAMRNRWRPQESLWQTRAGRDTVRVSEWQGSYGLWLCRAGSEPKLIASGFYFNPVVTPDGSWLVAVKRVKGEDHLVRINLRTNQEIAVATDNFFYPVVLVPASAKVMFTHYRGKEREHVLLDAATGSIETVNGEIGPLEQVHGRGLQQISGSTEYWAAVPDFKATETKVGRYDARTFKFTPMLTLPGICFISANMWIDESANRLYLAYNGHLLRLPFAAKSR